MRNCLIANLMVKNLTSLLQSYYSHLALSNSCQDDEPRTNYVAFAYATIQFIPLFWLSHDYAIEDKSIVLDPPLGYV